MAHFFIILLKRGELENSPKAIGKSRKKVKPQSKAVQVTAKNSIKNNQPLDYAYITLNRRYMKKPRANGEERENLAVQLVSHANCSGTFRVDTNYETSSCCRFWIYLKMHVNHCWTASWLRTNTFWIPELNVGSQLIHCRFGLISKIAILHNACCVKQLFARDLKPLHKFHISICK